MNLKNGLLNNLPFLIYSPLVLTVRRNCFTLPNFAPEQKFEPIRTEYDAVNLLKKGIIPTTLWHVLLNFSDDFIFIKNKTGRLHLDLHVLILCYLVLMILSKCCII